MPPLHAVISGAIQMVGIAATRGGRRAAPWSAASAHVQCARLLLDAGAQPGSKDIAGYTAFHRW